MADKNMKAKINVEFTEATSRQSIESGDSVNTLFGKIKKFFSDLKSVAFSGSYNDLSDKPTIPTKTSQLTNDSGYKTTDNNTTYSLSKSGTDIILTGSDGSKASVADTNTWRGIQDNLTSTSTTDSLSANQGKALNEKIDGIQVGGRNLLPIKIWENGHWWGNSTDSIYKRTNITFPAGTYTFTKYKDISEYADNDCPFVFIKYDSETNTGDTDTIITLSNFYAGTQTFNTTYPFRLYIQHNITWERLNLILKSVKLEKGNKATDWTPAPEDLALADHTHSKIQDSNSGADTTFAYSKAGMNYADYSWLAGWNGSELRKIDKSQFAQASHTHSLAEIGAAASSHTHSYLPLSGGTMTGEIISTSANALRAIYGDYGFIIRNDGNNTYFLLTNSGDQYGVWNSLRPMRIENANGNVRFAKGRVAIEHSTGNIAAPTFTGALSGNASTATALTSSAGSATQPVYFSGGKPVACTYTLGKSVPSNAVFTDTNTWRGIQNNLTSDSTTDSLSAAQGKVLKGLVDGKANTSHTHSYLPLSGGTVTGNLTVNGTFKANNIITGTKPLTISSASALASISLTSKDLGFTPSVNTSIVATVRKECAPTTLYLNTYTTFYNGTLYVCITNGSSTSTTVPTGTYHIDYIITNNT